MRTTNNASGEAQSPAAETLLQDTLKAIQGALLCLDEGNTARAAQLLYNILPPGMRPTR